MAAIDDSKNDPQVPSNPEAHPNPNNPLGVKIQQIIDKGLANQDPRTLKLLDNETNPNLKDTATDENHQLFNEENEVKTLPRWLEKFNAWRRRYMSDYIFLVWLATIVGIIAGFAAHVFNRMISILSDVFMNHINPDKVNWWLIFLPIAGILLVGIYTRYVIRTDLTHGVTRLMHTIYKGRYLLKRNLIYSPILGSTITLGFGGSAGSEGPIAISGAAIGSNLGRWLQLKMPLVKVLVGCGAAAGISGIFQSPVGGVLFTIEFLKMEIGTLSILAVVLACLVAYGMVFLCNGFQIPHQFYPDDVINPDQYGAVIAMGFLCGLYSLYYSMVINRSDKIFISIRNPWIRNLIGGAFVGLCIMLFPALYGVGYPVMSEVIHRQFDAITNGNVLMGMHVGIWGIMIVSLLILGIKCWACGACNASGGVSSDFAPTLYAGAIAGFLFSYFCNNVLHTDLPIPAFVIMGMAAVMAGCIEAPMMSIFIVINMGTDFSFMMAIILAVYCSYITVRVLSNIRGYNSKLARHIQWFRIHMQEENTPQTDNTTAPFQT